MLRHDAVDVERVPLGGHKYATASPVPARPTTTMTRALDRVCPSGTPQYSHPGFVV
jgi:hypothetical protein